MASNRRQSSSGRFGRQSAPGASSRERRAPSQGRSSRYAAPAPGSSRPASPRSGLGSLPQIDGTNVPRRASSRPSRPSQSSPLVGASRSASRGPSSTPEPYQVIPGGRSPARRGASSELSSVRIGDIGARDARRRPGSRSPQAPAKKPRRWPFVVAVLLVVLVAAGALAYAVASRSSALSVEEIKVTGVEHLTASEMSALINIPEGTTLLQADVAAIERRLTADAWIQSAHVSVEFPNTLVVDVVERQISAVVEVPSGANQAVRQWAIAKDGVWLMPIPDQNSEAGQAISPKVYEDAQAALHIVDVPYGVQPEIGAQCADGNVQNALDIVSGMTTDLASQVKVVSATDPESTTLLLDNGIEIAFGAATNIRDKERVCLQLMKEHEGSIAYINVRSVERPTWRAL